jgi:hypothetical protein
MKQLIVITCCFLVFFAGAASAWASCKQISFGLDGHHGPATSAHRHGHHADSDHEHSHDSVIHCASLDQFLPPGTFSVSKNQRIEHLLDVSLLPLDFQSSQRGYHLTHGPPGLAYLSFVPPYLLLSVLRI